ncbi:MAG: hypothetical protein KC996_06115, partial [Phycisphaerales bacterium]|nr:hypothetical protein [Phycisphaerales bacterium]
TVKFKVGRKMREALEKPAKPAATKPVTDGARADDTRRNHTPEIHMGPAIAGKIGVPSSETAASR